MSGLPCGALVWAHPPSFSQEAPPLTPCYSFLSRRYALQLLTPASILSKVQGRTEIALEDVAETDGLFLDAKSSARMLHERGEGQYLR